MTGCTIAAISAALGYTPSAGSVVEVPAAIWHSIPALRLQWLRRAQRVTESAGASSMRLSSHRRDKGRAGSKQVNSNSLQRASKSRRRERACFSFRRSSQELDDTNCQWVPVHRTSRFVGFLGSYTTSQSDHISPRSITRTTTARIVWSTVIQSCGLMFGRSGIRRLYAVDPIRPSRPTPNCQKCGTYSLQLMVVIDTGPIPSCHPSPPNSAARHNQWSRSRCRPCAARTTGVARHRRTGRHRAQRCGDIPSTTLRAGARRWLACCRAS